ncbi:hypothetical protein EDD17DRAFT_1595826, partial [Pisolithus thermaeus]
MVLMDSPRLPPFSVLALLFRLLKSNSAISFSLWYIFQASSFFGAFIYFRVYLLLMTNPTMGFLHHGDVAETK